MSKTEEDSCNFRGVKLGLGTSLLQKREILPWWGAATCCSSRTNQTEVHSIRGWWSGPCSYSIPSGCSRTELMRKILPSQSLLLYRSITKTRKSNICIRSLALRQGWGALAWNNREVRQREVSQRVGDNGSPVVKVNSKLRK